MNLTKLKWLVLLLVAGAAASVLAAGVKVDAASEIKRLAALMQWKQGTAVADIGAGDGGYTFAAAELVGATGKVYATEIDTKKLDELRVEVAKRNLQNVTVI